MNDTKNPLEKAFRDIEKLKLKSPITTNLPYAQSERLFRNYESHIAQIIANWPKPTVFDVKGVNVTTFGNRLRSAMNSYYESQWSSVLIDRTKFVNNFPDIAISLVDQPGKVVVGPKGSIKNRRAQGQGHSSTTAQVTTESLTQPTTTSPTEGLSITNPPREVVRALLVLHHYQILVNPTVVTITDDQPIIDAGEYDVIVQQDGNTFTIL